MNIIEKIERTILEYETNFMNNPEKEIVVKWLKWVLEELNKMICDNCSKKDKKTLGNPDGCSIYKQCKRFGIYFCSEWEEK